MPFSLTDHFHRIDAWLTQNRSLWQCMPFALTDLPWKDTHPELCEWLDSLSSEDIEILSHSPEISISMASPFLPDLAEWVELISLPDATVYHQQAHPHLAVNVPGRKWQQVTQFDQALPLNKTGKWLEWCAGKGFLGRVISASRSASVLSLEWQSALCDLGEKEAMKWSLPITFAQQDAFSASATQSVELCQHAVALHACGDLHVALIHHGIASQIETLALSPCCYHLIQTDTYHALSSCAQDSALCLSKLDLKLPLQELVTASQGEQLKRQKELVYRLGFDALQRHLAISDAYMPVPNIKKSFLNEGFVAFCQWAARKKGFEIPEHEEIASFEKEGRRRALEVNKMEIVRAWFKRPLEIWLALDRAVLLEENGYQVSLSVFCERQLTPRNLLILASRCE